MATPHLTTLERVQTGTLERVLNLAVPVYVAVLLAAIPVVPLCLVAAGSPVSAALRTTLLGIIAGYTPLVVLAAGTDRGEATRV